jgi:hypothetical protein
VSIRAVVLAAALTVLVPFLAACGGSSKNASEPLPTTPTLTVPGDSKTPTVDNSVSTGTTTTDTTTSTTPTTTATAPATTTTQTTPATPQGGTAAPQTGGATPGTTQTTTPPANSPASKFEQFCKENPGAC